MKNIREQFEEAIKSIEVVMDDEYDVPAVNDAGIAEKCESIADTQSIEFAKWIAYNANKLSSQIGDDGEFDLGKALSEFKAEHYK